LSLGTAPYWWIFRDFNLRTVHGVNDDPVVLDLTLNVIAVLKRGYSDGEAQDEEMPVL
jgi:hypothetical protein